VKPTNGSLARGTDKYPRVFIQFRAEEAPGVFPERVLVYDYAPPTTTDRAAMDLLAFGKSELRPPSLPSLRRSAGLRSSQKFLRDGRFPRTRLSDPRVRATTRTSGHLDLKKEKKTDEQ